MLSKSSLACSVAIALVCIVTTVSPVEARKRADFAAESDRRAFVEDRFLRSREMKAEAELLARQLNMPIRKDYGDRLIEIVGFRDGRPFYYTTHNVNAAISTAADLVRATAPYNLNGAGLVAGIWDGGSVLATHQEFGNRVNVMDGAASHYHATHVGGTIAATGIVANALGMAPSIEVYSYDWNSDASEAAALAAAYPDEAMTIYLSNHSYGYITGWYYDTGDGKYYYYGVYGEREDRGFGMYDQSAEDWDTIIYSAPYYLPFKSAGNDRNDNAPSSGTTYYYYNDGWQTKSYNPATDPYDDGFDNGGYDTVAYSACAKNLMTVGAVNDAVSGGSRSVAAGTMSIFSGWGPTDDGRVKPDIVANGVGVYSTDNGNNSDYRTLNGTSMSTPNACGSAALLVEYFGDLFPGHAMLASTLKGLIIHTADDTGNTGPDYRFGWGLMNTKAAADHIADYADSPGTRKIVEACLTTNNILDSYNVESDGTNPLKITVCWTDPPGGSIDALDDSTSVLVNDLDLVVTGPEGVTNYPYILNRLNPSATATNSENNIDNVEQVVVSTTTAGTYTVSVDYDGSLSGGEQRYSLFISGGPSEVTADPPSLASLGSTNGYGIIRLTAAGSGFQLGADVKLTRAGESDIEATGEMVCPETISAYLDLSGAAPGVWNVVVANPDGQTATLLSAFTILSVTYSESFESGTGAWTNSAGNDFNWSRNSGGTISSGTGPSSAHDGSWYMYTESSSPNYPYKQAGMENEFDLTDANGPELIFYYHMYGSSMGSLHVDIKDLSDPMGDWTNDVWSVSGQQHASEDADWTKATIDLSEYEGSEIAIRFRGITGSSYQSDIGVDGITIMEDEDDPGGPSVPASGSLGLLILGFIMFAAGHGFRRRSRRS